MSYGIVVCGFSSSRGSVLPLVSGIYGLFLWLMTGSDSSVFSIIATISIFLLIRSQINGSKSFSTVATILPTMSSLVHMVLSVVYGESKYNVPLFACSELIVSYRYWTPDNQCRVDCRDDGCPHHCRVGCSSFCEEHNQLSCGPTCVV